MINILFCGINGRMGRNTVETIASSKQFSQKYNICAGVDLFGEGAFSFPVYKSFNEVCEKADVIIDFSNHSLLPEILDYSVKNGIPAVICTTGHTEEEQELMKKASLSVPLFFSRNMSVGINLLSLLTKKAAEMLGEDFDIEIVEAHHNKKLDAPSGTALMLADAVSKGLTYTPEYVYDRHSYRKEREHQEIGIHSVRGGTIVGEHSVIFAGSNEVLTLSHSASSRAVFASGALRAAEFIITRSAGLYDMNDVVEEMI